MIYRIFFKFNPTLPLINYNSNNSVADENETPVRQNCSMYLERTKTTFRPQRRHVPVSSRSREVDHQKMAAQGRPSFLLISNINSN
jgi:hypothetical protein